MLILNDEDLEKKIASKKLQYQTELNDLTQQHEIETQELSLIVDELIKIDMVAK